MIWPAVLFASLVCLLSISYHEMYLKFPRVSCHQLCSKEHNYCFFKKYDCSYILFQTSPSKYFVLSIWKLAHHLFILLHVSGAFVGCSLNGSMVATRTSENCRFYGDSSIKASDILLGSLPKPPAAATLYNALSDLYQKLEKWSALNWSRVLIFWCWNHSLCQCIVRRG